ncbi:hypothetical protein HDV57DRAFT_147686 [Trichoderma longibrachiatum]
MRPGVFHLSRYLPRRQDMARATWPPRNEASRGQTGRNGARHAAGRLVRQARCRLGFIGAEVIGDFLECVVMMRVKERKAAAVIALRSVALLCSFLWLFSLPSCQITDASSSRSLSCFVLVTLHPSFHQIVESSSRCRFIEVPCGLPGAPTAMSRRPPLKDPPNYSALPPETAH